MTEEISLENYEKKRQELVEANSNPVGVVMREKELRVNELLCGLKKEVSEIYGGQIPYDMPVLTDKALTACRLYRFCSRMPKGADLHVHDMSLLPFPELCRLIASREEFYINADHRNYDLRWVKPGENPPEGYLPFGRSLRDGVFTEAELIENWTVVGAPKSGMRVWDYFETLFDRHAALSGNPVFAECYYDHAFRYYCRKHIQHVEIHLMLTDSIDESAEYVKMIRDTYYRVKEDYPFFTVKIIGAGVKSDTNKLELTKKCFLNTLYVQEHIKEKNGEDFIIGFDLVNEEDVSLPLSAFAPMLLKAKSRYPDIKFFIHGGESLDAENDNLIDAYLLGVARVGHGLNLYRYPDLLNRYVKSEICLEVCPISNQTLGYTKDIRNHPATEYLRYGVAVALCSDDPTYMENETLTDDFFAATLGWNLDLADLKQLGINSIRYSGMGRAEITAALRAFNREWNDFIDECLEMND